MESKNNKKKKSIFGILFLGCLPRMFMLFLLFVIIITISLNTLPKYKFFQEFAGEQVTSILEDVLEAETKIGSIFFGRFGYLELNQVYIFTKGDTLAYIPKVIVDVDLLSYLDNSISVDQVSLESPRIKMLRLKDGSWNVNHIAKKSNDTTSSGDSSIPLIDIDNLTINNGKFILFDSLQLNPDSIYKSKLLNYSYLNVENLNVNLEGEIDLDDNEMNFDINGISLNEINTGLILSNLKIDDLQFNDNKISYDEMELVFDNQSIISENLNLTNFSILNSEKSDITKADIDFSIKSDSISIETIEHFTDGVQVLGGSYQFQFDISGELNNPTINKLNFSNQDLLAEFKGDLTNMFSPDIQYHLTSNKLNTNNKFIATLIDVINIKSLPKFKKYKVNQLEIRGGVSESNLDINLYADKSQIKLKNYINHFSLEFESDIKFQNLNLKPIEESLVSNLSGTINLAGSGFDIFKDSININLYLANSSFQEIKLDKIQTSINIEEGLINIDSLNLGYDNQLKLNGNLDVSNINEPYYFMKINANNLNTGFIADSLPNNISSEITLSGTGFDIENMDLNLGAKVENITINNHDFKDITISTKLLSDISGNKQITLSSAFLDIIATGNFKYNDLAKLLKIETNIFSNKISEISDIAFDTLSINKDILMESIPNVELQLKSNLKDISKFDPYIQNMSLDTEGYLTLNVKSDSSSISISTDEFHFEHTNFKTDSLDLYSERVDLKFSVKHSKIDSIITFDEFEMDVSSDEVQIGDQNADSTYINLILLDEKLNIDLQTLYDNQFVFEFGGFLDKEGSVINYSFDNFVFGYKDLIRYQNTKNFAGEIKNNILEINDLEIKDVNNETIKLIGGYNFAENKFDNLDLNLANYSIENLIKIGSENPFLEILYGNISILSLRLNGDFENPKIDIVADGENIEYNEINLGQLSSEIYYENKIIYGDLYLFNQETGTNFSIKINTLPIDLRFIDVENRLHDLDQTDIFISMYNFPITTAEPFAVGLSNLQGNLNSEIKITGDVSKHIDYSGYLSSKDFSFLVDATNIEYNSDMKFNISNDSIAIENFIIRNRKQDYKKGQAELTGVLKMNDFTPTDFDFKVNTNGFKVLREETKFTMPWLYGDLIIGTGNEDLSFYGTFDEPNIKGDINVLKANLNMPLENSVKLVESQLKYVFKDSILTIESIENREVKKIKKESDFADLINYDVFIDLKNDINIKYDLNAFIKLNSYIDAENLHYLKDRKNELPKILGSILVEKPSLVKLTILNKEFETTGIVKFPTGEVTNPSFDLIAKYENIDRQGNFYLVKIFITGNNEKPEIAYEIDYNGATYGGEQAQRDFYSLAVINSRIQDIGGADNSNSGASEIGSDITNSLISSLVSQNISQAIGFDTEIDFDVNNPDNTTVTIEGGYAGIRWQIGGTPSNPENNEIAVVIPAKIIVPYAVFEQIELEFSKPNNPYATRENQKQWEINVNYKTKW